MKEDKKRKADRIIASIANANNTTPKVMQSQIDAALDRIARNTSQPQGRMLNDLFPNGRPTTDEFVVALERELYDSMIPKYEGWEWDGVGYRNIALPGRLSSPQ